jgi:hypothetical protein
MDLKNQLQKLFEPGCPTALLWEVKLDPLSINSIS